jgi:hypothetical protein
MVSALVSGGAIAEWRASVWWISGVENSENSGFSVGNTPEESPRQASGLGRGFPQSFHVQIHLYMDAPPLADMCPRQPNVLPLHDGN